ncbi:MAG: hypothetical protein NTW25_15835 [Candidatus Kapabacteria bacterium]|nr:hypothetical protein [Candidatus Kapabacteria bacterium]
MRKLFFVFLLAMFLQISVSKADNISDFYAECSSNGGSIIIVPITYYSCVGKIYICVIPTGSTATTQNFRFSYGPFISNNSNCDMFSLNNLINPSFWTNISSQILNHIASIPAYSPGDCSLEATSTNKQTFVTTEMFVCQKIINFGAPQNQQMLVNCSTANFCSITYSLCWRYSGQANSQKVLELVKISSSNQQSGWACPTILPDMSNYNLSLPWETECFSLPCIN